MRIYSYAKNLNKKAPFRLFSLHYIRINLEMILFQKDFQIYFFSFLQPEKRSQLPITDIIWLNL